MHDVLASAGLDKLPAPSRRALCFVKGHWPLPLPPGSFRGMRLEGPRSLRNLLTRSPLLDDATIARLAAILGRAFPPK